VEQAERVGEGIAEGESEIVKLYPGQDKTPRGTFYLGIVFPRESRALFIYYLRFARPAMMRSQKEEQVSADALSTEILFLIHTETGTPVSGESLKNKLRTYVGRLNCLRGDLSHVTVMTVRAFFTSVSFPACRRGKFAPKTTNEFLDDLAEVLNTSLEMLRTTYISTDGKEFEESAIHFYEPPWRNDDQMLQRRNSEMFVHFLLFVIRLSFLQTRLALET
jgi:hypothetical protein